MGHSPQKDPANRGTGCLKLIIRHCFESLRDGLAPRKGNQAGKCNLAIWLPLNRIPRYTQ
jgi:hypothetical protein